MRMLRNQESFGSNFSTCDTFCEKIGTVSLGHHLSLSLKSVNVHGMLLKLHLMSRTCNSFLKGRGSTKDQLLKDAHISLGGLRV